MLESNADHNTGSLIRKGFPSITESAVVPALIENAGSDTKRRYVEFFNANISNPNTRAADLRAVVRFCDWCDVRKVTLAQTEPTLIALYVAELSATHSRPTVKQHLAAIRVLFDYFVTGGLLRSNPASSVRGPKHVVVKGKTPVLQPQDARHLLDSIPTETIVGPRDRALIFPRQYTFARIVAAVAVDTDDIFVNGRRCFVQLREKGGRQHKMPLHNIAEETVLFAAFFLHGREMSRWAIIVANRNFCFAIADCVSKPRSAAEMMN